ncbi:MAG: hypothetical protein KAS32_10955 [Candidatus Peribacteraceae bacterium]|nr:hypothetical protein [Candidatus Peribacteraceae bacterium]
MKRILFTLLILILSAQAVEATSARHRRSHLFKPTQYANLELWLDASAITGVGDGGAVANWLDQSGNGYDFTASGTPTLETFEQGGKPVVNFSGTGEFFTSDDVAATWDFLHNVAGRTIITVARVTDAHPDNTQYLLSTYNNSTLTSGYNFIFEDRDSQSANETFRVLMGKSSDGNFVLNITGTTFGSNIYPFQQFNILSDYFYSTTGDDYKLRINGIEEHSSGVLNAPANNAAWSTLHIGTYADGHSANLKGDMAETAMYSAPLTILQTKRLEQYYRQKYIIRP